MATDKSYDSGRVIGHRLLGMTLVSKGEASKAKEQLELSLALYSAERDAAAGFMFGQNIQVHTQSLLSVALFCLGHVDEAVKVGLDALEAADDLRHPHSTALALGYVGGFLFALCGAKLELMRRARQLISLSDEHRLGAFRLLGSAFLGWSLCQQGDLENGIATLEEAIDKLESIEFRLSMTSYLAILADAQRQQGNVDDAKKTCDRALALISSGADLWFEPEVLRIDALIESDLRPPNAEKIEAKFRRSIDCAKKLGFPVFELRGLLTLQNSFGLNRHDIEIESRIKELSHLQDLDRRVEVAIEARRIRHGLGRAKREQ